MGSEHPTNVPLRNKSLFYSLSVTDELEVASVMDICLFLATCHSVVC